MPLLAISCAYLTHFHCYFEYLLKEEVQAKYPRLILLCLPCPRPEISCLSKEGTLMLIAAKVSSLPGRFSSRAGKYKNANTYTHTVLCSHQCAQFHSPRLLPFLFYLVSVFFQLESQLQTKTFPLLLNAIIHLK